MNSVQTSQRWRLNRKKINVREFLVSEGFRIQEIDGGPWADIGLCPFHRDSRPTLRANLESGRVRCLKCQWTGDPVAFVQQRHGLTFTDAAIRLGAREEIK